MAPSAIHANAMNLMAQRGETTALQRAIDQGADVNEVDPGGRSAEFRRKQPVLQW